MFQSVKEMTESREEFEKQWKERLSSQMIFLRSLKDHWDNDPEYVIPSEEVVLAPLPEILELIESCFEKVLSNNLLFHMYPVDYGGYVDVDFPERISMTFEKDTAIFAFRDETWKSFVMEYPQDKKECVALLQATFEKYLK